MIASAVTTVIILGIMRQTYGNDTMTFEKSEETDIESEVDLNGGVNVTEDIPEFDLMTEDEQNEIKEAAYEGALFFPYVDTENLELNSSFNEYIETLSDDDIPILMFSMKALSDMSGAASSELNYLSSEYDDEHHVYFLIIKADNTNYNIYNVNNGCYIGESK